MRAADRSRYGDVVALDFFADRKYLAIDVVVTSVYRNTVFPRVSTIPCYAAKRAEDRKFLADIYSRHPIATPHGGPRVLAPFTIEDGGRLGAHAQALHRALATTSLAKGRTPP